VPVHSFSVSQDDGVLFVVHTLLCGGVDCKWR